MISKRRIAAIVNCDGGTLRSMDTVELTDRMRDSWTASGHTVDIDCVSGNDLIASLEEVGRDAANDTIVVAGGDGTVSAAAGVAWKNKKALGVLPAGTMNLFSRSLGSPLDLGEAIEAIGLGHVAECDIATANGRPFVHMFGVGLHPRAMKERDKLDYDSRHGKMIASARALFAVVKRPRRFRAVLIHDGTASERRLSALSVSNNRLSEGHLPFADRIDEGVLGFYCSHARSLWESAKLVVDIMRGSWSDNQTVTKGTASIVDLEFRSLWRDAKATIDGEVIPLDRKVEFRIHPRELQVLLPPKHLSEDR